MAVAQHIGKLANLPCVLDRLIERDGKMVRRQYGHVSVLGFFILKAVTVYDGKTALVVFLCDEAAGVLTERANLIVIRRDVTNQLAFIQNRVDFFHNLVTALHPDADIDDARATVNAVFTANIIQPVGADTANCNNGFIRFYFILFARGMDNEICTAANTVLNNKVARGRIENDIDAVINKILLNF